MLKQHWHGQYHLSDSSSIALQTCIFQVSGAIFLHGSLPIWTAHLCLLCRRFSPKCAPLPGRGYHGRGWDWWRCLLENLFRYIRWFYLVLLYDISILLHMYSHFFMIDRANIDFTSTFLSRLLQALFPRRKSLFQQTNFAFFATKESCNYMSICFRCEWSML